MGSGMNDAYGRHFGDNQPKESPQCYTLLETYLRFCTAPPRMLQMELVEEPLSQDDRNHFDEEAFTLSEKSSKQAKEVEQLTTLEDMASLEFKDGGDSITQPATHQGHGPKPPYPNLRPGDSGSMMDSASSTVR